MRPASRIVYAARLQEVLIDAAKRSLATRSQGASIGMLDALQQRIGEVECMIEPLVVIDFPSRGIPKEPNAPTEIGDALRKYFAVGGRPATKEFDLARRMQMDHATLRVYAAPELHEMLLRFLPSNEVERIVRSTLDLAGSG